MFGINKPTRPLPRGEVLVNIQVLNRIISFPALIKRIPKFIRLVNKKVATETKEMSDVARYRVYYDKENRTITYMVGQSYNYDVVTILLDSIFELIDNDTALMMASSAHYMLRKLPEQIDKTKPIDTGVFPHVVRITLEDDDIITDDIYVNLLDITDKAARLSLLCMLSYLDILEENHLHHVVIEDKYQEWLYQQLDVNYQVSYDKVAQYTKPIDYPDVNFKLTQMKEDGFIFIGMGD